MIKKIEQIAQGLNKKFPDGNEPFRIITRLAEECGELAKKVNHFEKTGRKVEKYGEPDKMKMAKEVQDVIRAALQIASYYEIGKELNESVNNSYEKLKNDGFIK